MSMIQESNVNEKLAGNEGGRARRRALRRSCQPIWMGGLLVALASAGCSADGQRDAASLGEAALPLRCGTTNDYQDVELYNGNLGVPKALVAERQPSVGEGKTSLGLCSGTLIASDLFLSAGHCQYDLNSEVRFKNQLDASGHARTMDHRAVTQVIEQENTLGIGDPAQQFDYAVVRLASSPGTTYGYSKLANDEARTVAVFNQTLMAISHPDLGLSFDYKKVSTGPYVDALPSLQPNWFGAQIDLEHGSSGCSIMRPDGQIVGLHTTTGCTGMAGDSAGNHNMRMPPLLAHSLILRQVAAMQGVQFANVNGTGGADAVIVNFAGIQARNSNGASFASSATWTTNAFYGSQGTFFADVTGDGRADAIVVNNNNITVRRSNGSSFSTTNETWSSIPFWGSIGTYFADVTGDGKADAIAVDPGGVVVSAANSTATGFASPRSWSSAFYGSLMTAFADVTGDGRADIIAVDDGAVSVGLSTGSSFGFAQNWSGNRFFGAMGTFFADVTGDGKADMIGVNNGVTTVRRSNGSSFTANENWLTTSHFGSLGTAFADVTGDGKADSIAVTPTGITVRPANSTATAFGSLSTWVSSGYFGAM